MDRKTLKEFLDEKAKIERGLFITLEQAKKRYRIRRKRPTPERDLSEVKEMREDVAAGKRYRLMRSGADADLLEPGGVHRRPRTVRPVRV